MKVLLIEPDTGARRKLCTIVQELAENVDILEAHDDDAITAHVGKHSDLSLLIADYHLARTAGLLAKRARPLPRQSGHLVLLSSSPCYIELLSAMEHGAMAYLPVRAARPITLAALQIVMAGDRYFPPDLLVGTREGDWEAHPSIWPSLTSRQMEVLTHMAAGRSNKSIARELGMSAGTVKVHVGAILKALNARNRTEAVIWAQRGHGNRRGQHSHGMRRQVRVFQRQVHPTQTGSARLSKNERGSRS